MNSGDDLFYKHTGIKSIEPVEPKAFDWDKHEECLSGSDKGSVWCDDCETDRAEMIAEGKRLEGLVRELEAENARLNLLLMGYRGLVARANGLSPEAEAEWLRERLKAEAKP